MTLVTLACISSGLVIAHPIINIKRRICALFWRF